MMSKLRNREESLRSSGEREKYQTQQRQCWSLLSGDEIHFFSDSLRRPEWTEYQKWTAKEGKIISYILLTVLQTLPQWREIQSAHLLCAFRVQGQSKDNFEQGHTKYKCNIIHIQSEKRKCHRGGNVLQFSTEGENTAWNHPSKRERQAIFRAMSCSSNGNAKPARLNAHCHCFPPTSEKLLASTHLGRVFLGVQEISLALRTTHIHASISTQQKTRYVKGCLSSAFLTLLPTLNSCNLDVERGP